MFDSMMPIHYLPSNTLHGCDISMDMPYVQMHHQKHFSNIQQGEMLWDYQREGLSMKLKNDDIFSNQIYRIMFFFNVWEFHLF